MIFVDTGVWFAILHEKDPLHHRATKWFQELTEDIVTSDYVIDETLTLLLMRGERRKSLEFGNRTIVENGSNLVFISEDQFNRSWLFFQRMISQGLSFTDCTSHIVIQDLELRTVATFDHHFSATGRFTIVP